MKSGYLSHYKYQTPNMRHYLILFMALSAFTTFTSCSSEETPEDYLMGGWEGTLSQADLGNFTASISISNVKLNTQIATAKYGANDFADCNPEFFDCNVTGSPCSSSWEYNGFINNVFTITETSSPSSTCAPGTVTLTKSGDNKLQYNWIEISDPLNVASGVLTRQ